MNFLLNQVCIKIPEPYDKYRSKIEKRERKKSIPWIMATMQWSGAAHTRYSVNQPFLLKNSVIIIVIAEICFIDFWAALENITNQFSIKMFKSNIGKIMKGFIILSSVEMLRFIFKTVVLKM
jgi:hypothetical protein